MVLFETALKSAEDDSETRTRGFDSANGSFSRRGSISGAGRAQSLGALRDVAATITLVCGIASCFMEPSIIATSVSWEPVYRAYDLDWADVHNYQILQQVLWMVPVHVIVNVLSFVLVSTGLRLFPTQPPGQLHLQFGSSYPLAASLMASCYLLLTSWYSLLSKALSILPLQSYFRTFARSCNLRLLFRVSGLPLYTSQRRFCIPLGRHLPLLSSIYGVLYGLDASCSELQSFRSVVYFFNMHLRHTTTPSPPIHLPPSPLFTRHRPSISYRSTLAKDIQPLS